MRLPAPVDGASDMPQALANPPVRPAAVAQERTTHTTLRGHSAAPRFLLVNVAAAVPFTLHTPPRKAVKEPQ